MISAQATTSRIFLNQMTTQNKIEIVTKAVEAYRDLDAHWKPIIKAFKNHDFPAWVQSWKVYEAYIDMASVLIGDNGQLLDWYIFDNQCGKNKLPAKASSWKREKAISSPELLVKLIEADSQNY